MTQYGEDTGGWETSDRKSEEKLRRTETGEDPTLIQMCGLQLQKDFTLTVQLNSVHTKRKTNVFLKLILHMVVCSLY